MSKLDVTLNGKSHGAPTLAAYAEPVWLVEHLRDDNTVAISYETRAASWAEARAKYLAQYTDAKVAERSLRCTRKGGQ